MSCSRRRLSLLLLTLVSSVAIRALAEPELLEIPQPDLSTMEPPVREELQRRYLAAAEATSAAERAEAFGELGRLCRYFALKEPAKAALRNASTLAPQDVRWIYLLGTVLEDEGSFRESAKLYRRVLKLDPQDIAALLRLGQVELAANEPTAAERSFHAALKVNRSSAAAHYGLGRVAAATGRPEDAVRHFEKALEHQAGATAIHYPLGLAYRALGDLEQARSHLARRGDVEVGFPDPLVRERPELDLGSAGYVVRGNQARRQGDYEGAIALYRRAIAEAPADAEAHGALASVLMLQGKRDEALAALASALEIEPRKPVFHYNRGRILADQKRFGEAARAFGTAVELDPGFSNARFNLATALAHQGRFAEAAKELRALVELEPWDANVHMRYAEILARQGRFAEAATAYRAAIDLMPEDRQARFAEATALILAERYRDARQRLEEAIAALPGDLNLTHALARLLATCPLDAVRDGESALRLARQVFQTESTPDHAETLAMALAEVGRFEDASNWQRRIVAEAERAGLERRLGPMRERLALYLSKRPARAPWRAGNAP